MHLNEVLHSKSENICHRKQECISVLQLELLVKFAAYVPELVMSQIDAVYFYNASVAFKQYSTKLATAIRIFSHIKVCDYFNYIIASIHMHSMYYISHYIIISRVRNGW